MMGLEVTDVSSTYGKDTAILRPRHRANPRTRHANQRPIRRPRLHHRREGRTNRRRHGHGLPANTSSQEPTHHCCDTWPSPRPLTEHQRLLPAKDQISRHGRSRSHARRRRLCAGDGQDSCGDTAGDTSDVSLLSNHQLQGRNAAARLAERSCTGIDCR